MSAEEPTAAGGPPALPSFPPPGPPVPAVNPWLIAIAVMLATFMEVLDTTIVTVSLPHMAGNLSATTDEATWVVTSYLISNAIILPTSGWLARMFGRKRFLITCIVIFTLSSFLCGVATSLGALIVARILQGVGGGALQPLSQAILLESFPPARRGMAMAVFGIGVVCAPIFGPTLGGWITDNFSWRWIFYINIPIGVFAVLAIQQFVRDPHYIRHARLGRIDALGFGLMAIWLATFQIILDKGQQEDWFAAVWIRWFAVISVSAMVAFLIRELRSGEPIVNLRVLKNRNFGIGTFLMLMMGVVIYSPLTLIPLFLQNLMGYPALQSGLAQSPRGLGSLLMMPIVGRLTGRVDNRLLMMTGFSLLGVSCFLFGDINLQIAMSSVVWPNVLQGMSMAMIFVPLTTTAMAMLRNDQMGNATGIFNLVRNLGGGLGISAVTTMLARGAQAHQAVMVSHLTPYDPAFTRQMQSLTQTLSSQVDAVRAERQASAIIYGTLINQATLLAFVNNFRWLALLCFICVPAVFLLKRGMAHVPGAAH
ncbi:MAG TPA: DHA2 family efflux MFS transporter permease subunit [Candidatus Methylomirabilis sp.]|nr:DHA2 family efflux MFS transporter permease subunit [Candidatus Methylomirabilis sp.]